MRKGIVGRSGRVAVLAAAVGVLSALANAQLADYCPATVCPLSPNWTANGDPSLNAPGVDTAWWNGAVGIATNNLNAVLPENDPLDGNYQFYDPISGFDVNVCFAGFLKDNAIAAYQPGKDSIILNLQHWSDSNQSPSRLAMFSSVLVHEGAHRDQWLEILTTWLFSVCNGLTGGALFECELCVDDVLVCLAQPENEACIEVYGYLAQFHALCTEIDELNDELQMLQQNGASAEEISGLEGEIDIAEELMADACATAQGHWDGCLSDDKCPVTCGNMTPLPPPVFPESECMCEL